jgi:hypothetical protein
LFARPGSDLSLPANTKVKQGKNGSLQFNRNKAAVKGTKGQDQAMLPAYDVDNKIPYYNLTSQFRNIGSDVLVIDTTPGRTYQLYQR